MPALRQRAWLSWASVSLLAVLCAVLAVKQYEWIGEITAAERTRLREELQTRLLALSRNLNETVVADCYGLLPTAEELAQGRDAAYAVRYLRWRESHGRIFRRIALAVPENGEVHLRSLNLETA